jgi:hypothetical protein
MSISSIYLVSACRQLTTFRWTRESFSTVQASLLANIVYYIYNNIVIVRLLYYCGGDGDASKTYYCTLRPNYKAL